MFIIIIKFVRRKPYRGMPQASHEMNICHERPMTQKNQYTYTVSQ